MLGHVQLDSIEYITVDQRNPTRSNANELAAKLGSGGGDYDDLLSFNAFLQANWQAGIGKKDPEAGGALVSTLDTRFENQMALPPITRLIPSTSSPQELPYSENYLEILDTITATRDYTTITVSDTETGVTGAHKLANQFRQNDGTAPIDTFEVLLPGKSSSCTQVYVELWEGYDPHGR